MSSLIFASRFVVCVVRLEIRVLREATALSSCVMVVVLSVADLNLIVWDG